MLNETVTRPLEALGGPRYRVRVIQGPRWGSSGYYSTEALDQGATVLAKGTKIYLDHPSASEDRDRPERSLRDLVGKIDGPVTREADGIYAVMEVLPHWAEVVSSLASGGGLDMSIRAMAEFHPGEAEGRHGVIIDRFTEFLSVDLVTEAGAGGRVLELIESARTVAEAPVSSDREALQAALAAAYAPGEDEYLWLRDFDPVAGLAWFEQSDRTYQQAFTRSGDAITLAGTPTEVTVRITYHPVGPVDTNPQEAVLPTIDEAEYKRLTETATAFPQLEAELAEARKMIDQINSDRATAEEAAKTARAEAAEARIAASTLPEVAKGRVREAIKADPSADVEAAIKAEADYLAAVAPTKPGLFGASETLPPSGPARTHDAWGHPYTKGA